MHANAEVGFDLKKTTAYLKQRLAQMGYTPKDCGKAGVVTTLGKPRKGGKAFLLRADTDALPIKERSGESFAAKNGNMHACGHDLHAATLLGAAALLKARENELFSEVKLLFQPAEETLEGAKECLKSGVLSAPEVGGAMMLHTLVDLPLKSGTLIVSSEGVSAPAADYFTVEVTGKSCHGSSPEKGVDALLCAAHILTALQEILSREIAYSTPATLTVGKCEAGAAGNVIAGKASLQGTIRAFDEDVRAFLKTRLCAVVKTVAKAFRARSSVRFTSGCPCLQNDGKLSAFLHETATGILGKERVKFSAELGRGGGGSEDFAYISREVPSIMAGLCAGERKQGYAYPLHHERARFDESVLPVGAAVFAAAAIGWGKLG